MVRKHSPEQLRRQLMELLDRETAGMDLPPDLAFVWDMSGRVASVRQLSSQRLRAEINLRAFERGDIPSEGALEFGLCFCACAVAEVLRLWESAADDRLSHTYLHGLARIEVLGQMRAKRGSLFLPLWGDRFPREFTAADLFCAVTAYPRALDRCGARLSPEEFALRRRMLTVLEAMAPVPEVVFHGRKRPESSLTCCVRTVETLRSGTRTAPEELLEKGEDPLCRGMALRLAAFGEETVVNPENRQILEAELHRVRRDSVAFVRLCGDARDGILRDELLALERLNAALNRMAARHGMIGQTGAIHPLTRG